MKKENTPDDDRLWSFIDGTLPEAELSALKSELANSPGLQQELEELKRVHQLLLRRENERPPLSPDFTQRVMDNLAHRPLMSSVMPSKNGLLLLGGIMVAVFIGVFLVGSGFFDGVQRPIPLSMPSTEDLPMTSIPFNGKVIMQVLILVNVVLAFLVLDKTVLRPYFSHRHRAPGV